MTPTKTIRIATRKSALALWQAEHIKKGTRAITYGLASRARADEHAGRCDSRHAARQNWW